MTLTLRPYHILCRIGYNGYGYSPEFISEMTRTVAILNSGRAKIIVARPGFDNICRCCPHAELECSLENTGPRGHLINELDKTVLRALKLKPGHPYPLPEIDERIAKLSCEDLNIICEKCEWKILGTCAEAHLRLQQKFRLNS